MTKTNTSKKPAEAPAKQTKIASVIALLKRPKGATLQELGKATSWQSHSIRAALTGLRKKGHAIEKDKRGETTCYRITGSAK